MNKIIEEAIAELERHDRGEIELPPDAKPRQVVIYYTDGAKFNVASFQLAGSGLINHMCQSCFKQLGYMTKAGADKIPLCGPCQSKKNLKGFTEKGK